MSGGRCSSILMDASRYKLFPYFGHRHGRDRTSDHTLGHDPPAISASHGLTGITSKSSIRLSSYCPGAQELITQVKGHGGMVVIVTSAKRDDILPSWLPSVRRTCFDSIIDGEDAERAKPHPDLFRSPSTARNCHPHRCWRSATRLGTSRRQLGQHQLHRSEDR
jgi:beta-phosphoglucomutase-like phosphatase (HAD superfamily)